jgi:hypothetical protein
VTVRFLLDENLPPRLKPAIARYPFQIDLLRVGDPGAPSLGTSDPDILQYVQTTQRLLITNYRESMPAHVAAHVANGGYHWGVLRVRPGTAIRQIADEIALIWEASEAKEWLNVEDWIPF